MNTERPFVFIHPDTGVETTERRGECSRLLWALDAQNGQWVETFELMLLLHSGEAPARMSNLKDAHGPNLIHSRNGRKARNGRQLKEYRLNPAVRVIREDE